MENLKILIFLENVKILIFLEDLKILIFFENLKIQIIYSEKPKIETKNNFFDNFLTSSKCRSPRKYAIFTTHAQDCNSAHLSLFTGIKTECFCNDGYTESGTGSDVSCSKTSSYSNNHCEEGKFQCANDRCIREEFRCDKGRVLNRLTHAANYAVAKRHFF